MRFGDYTSRVLVSASLVLGVGCNFDVCPEIFSNGFDETPPVAAPVLYVGASVADVR